jgi:hypothetical protein
MRRHTRTSAFRRLRRISTAATSHTRNFRVLWNVPDPDPHHFDGNHDGIGCES